MTSGSKGLYILSISQEYEEDLQRTQQELESRLEQLQLIESSEQRLSRDVSRLEQTLMEKEHTVQ